MKEQWRLSQKVLKVEICTNWGNLVATSCPLPKFLTQFKDLIKLVLQGRTEISSLFAQVCTYPRMYPGMHVPGRMYSATISFLYAPNMSHTYNIHHIPYILAYRPSFLHHIHSSKVGGRLICRIIEVWSHKAGCYLHVCVIFCLHRVEMLLFTYQRQRLALFTPLVSPNRGVKRLQ